MSKCENCLHKKDCIDGANFKNTENCERFKPKMALTQEEYLQRTSRCANCIHSKGVEDGYVYCYNSSRKNYPYAIDNFVFCSDFVERSEPKQKQSKLGTGGRAMREILFRGKRKDNGEWEYGLLAQYVEGITAGITPQHLFGVCDSSFYVPVVPETVGQYTGLIDKNCKKIFEGDIVKYGDTIHKVIFEQRNGTAYFGLVYNELETLPFGHYQDLKQIEVIGNIHDNPELLKESEDKENG